MQNKTLCEERNTNRRGDRVKCIVCGKEYLEWHDNGSILDSICDECEETFKELTNGKGEDE